MPEPKSKTSAFWVAIASIASLAAGAGGHHAIGAAQAQQATPGLATSDQLAKMEARLEAKIEKFIDRVQAVELEQAKQQGAQNATHRTR